VIVPFYNSLLHLFFAAKRNKRKSLQPQFFSNS
jgi:hypothetical protein